MPAYATEQITEEYIEEIYNPTSKDTMAASEQINMPIEQIVSAIEQKIEQYGNPKVENKENSEIVVQIGPKDDSSHSMYINKFYDILRLLYNQRRISFGKTLENLIFFILSAILAIGSVVFIAYIGYKIYYCTGTSKMLLKRLGQAQSDKIKLLKIIDTFSYQNATFYEMVRNETNF